MKLACPHCSQTLELTPDVLASLQGQPHFECPSCQGLITTPEQPRRPSASARAKANGKVQQSTNRNILVLGIAALVVLGGIAAFLASRNGGSITNIFQNTTNNIIHNKYFTQLIANGVTTLEDLKSIEEIRPYGDGFIGISKAQLNWSQAVELAKRTGSEVLAVENSATGTKQQLVEWLKTTFAAQFQPTLWVRQDGQTKVTDGNDVLVAASLESARKVALHWKLGMTGSTIEPSLATKDRPFTNSLGMKFVPVPGTKVLFCIHETRRQDYAAYAVDKPDADKSWQHIEQNGIPVSDKDAHPVAAISLRDAQAFCQWLSIREARRYRLPTDREWSVAIGISDQEPDNTPKELSEALKVYPWGKGWPPVKVTGNYADTHWSAAFPNMPPCIPGYTDGFAAAAPVMSFPPNNLGIYDLSGNVWEWCDGWWDEEKKEAILRGAAWNSFETYFLLSSCRPHHVPDRRSNDYGFRVVLEVPDTANPKPAAAAEIWPGFDPGPLVFEDSLNSPASLEKFWRFDGQYGGRFVSTHGAGIKAIGGHTWAMAWAQAVLGDRCRVEFEMSLEQGGEASWVVKGSGLGNSPDTGFGFHLAGKSLKAQREGNDWTAKTLSAELETLKWHQVRLDLDGPRLAVRLNGTLISDASAEVPLNGPLHGWLGFSGKGVSYRQLRIHSSEANQRQERQFLPPITIAPRANGDLIYRFAEPEGPLGGKWQVVEPESMEVKNQILVLQSSSHAMLDLPLAPPLALEVEHEFDHDQALNFGITLAHAAARPKTLPECSGCWQVHLPRGTGCHEIFWAAPGFRADSDFTNERFAPTPRSMTTTATAYYAPVPRRPQTIRCELVADSLRVFVDGRLLMQAKRPSDTHVSAPVFIGLGQFYSLSKITSLRIFKLEVQP